MNVRIAEKSDELIIKKDIDKKDSKEFTVYLTNPAQGPGDRFVGPAGIVLTMTYLFLLSVIIIYSLVLFWPPSVSALPQASAPLQEPAYSSVNSSNVTFFLWTFTISDEGRLFLIVALAGALGSLVHALRSFYWYVGNRELVLSWLAMYILLPVSGAVLGLIFYITIRGGLFPQATIQQTSPFGFVALSALVGMFSVQAALKLQDIAETVFTKAGEGRESKPQVREQDKHEKN